MRESLRRHDGIETDFKYSKITLETILTFQLSPPPWLIQVLEVWLASHDSGAIILTWNHFRIIITNISLELVYGLEILNKPLTIHCHSFEKWASIICVHIGHSISCSPLDWKPTRSRNSKKRWLNVASLHPHRSSASERNSTRTITSSTFWATHGGYQSSKAYAKIHPDSFLNCLVGSVMISQRFYWIVCVHVF